MNAAVGPCLLWRIARRQRRLGQNASRLIPRGISRDLLAECVPIRVLIAVQGQRPVRRRDEWVDSGIRGQRGGEAAGKIGGEIGFGQEDNALMQKPMAGAALAGSGDFPVVQDQITRRGKLCAKTPGGGGRGGGNESGAGLSGAFQGFGERFVQPGVGGGGSDLAKGMSMRHGEGPCMAKSLSMMHEAASSPAPDEGLPGFQRGEGFSVFLEIAEGKRGLLPAINAKDGTLDLRAVNKKGFVHGHVFRSLAG